MCMKLKLHNENYVVLVLQASVREQKKLLVENGKLKKDIEQLRIQLQEKQRRRTGTHTFECTAFAFPNAKSHSNIKPKVNPQTGL